MELFWNEKYHKNIVNQDFIRDNNIKNKIGCDIIRIDEKEFINKMNSKNLEEFKGGVDD